MKLEIEGKEESEKVVKLRLEKYEDKIGIKCDNYWLLMINPDGTFYRCKNINNWPNLDSGRLREDT
jgi:hypothetical protein